MYFKTCHAVRDPKSRCEDCDLNEPIVSVHHRKTKNCDENMKIIHLKLYRKDEYLVSLTEHLKLELFENDNNWANPKWKFTP